MEIKVQEPNELNVVWSVNPEYLDIMLKEKTKEKLLSKNISHNMCELAFIKRQLLREDFNSDIKVIGVLEIIDNFLSEKKDQVNLLEEMKGHTYMDINFIKKFWEEQGQDLRLIYENEEYNYYELVLEDTYNTEVLGYDFIEIYYKVKDTKIIKTAYQSHVGYKTDLYQEINNLIKEEND